MEKKELYSMKRHRGLFLTLGLAALMGLSAPEARAGNVTLTLTWTGGTTGPIDFTSPFAQLGSTANSLTIDTSVLNSFLAGNGSDFTFSELGASSNNPGDPSGAVLRETGTGILSGGGGATSIDIVATQTDFTSPSGPGTLISASSANFTSTAVGSQTSFGSLDATSTAPLAYSPPGGFAMNSTGATGSAAGYTLTASTTIDLTGGSTGASDQATNKVTFTAAAIPEPASIVMMLTGMPLPLVVLGLLRRRRAAA
jgi:hypothetical protein